MHSLVKKAKFFAKRAHEGQFRKYTNAPYINHPEAVYNIVKGIGGSVEQQAAAWLHDVVEDTPVTLEQIENEFGKTVAELVGWLTDVSRPENGNREVRKAIDRAHSAAAPSEAQTIKYADLIDNTSSITKYDQKFAKSYMKEKRQLLSVMDKGNAGLLNKCWAILLKWEAN